MIEESFKALRNDPTFKYFLSWARGGVDSVLKGSRICNYRIFNLAQYSLFIYLEYNSKSQVKNTLLHSYLVSHTLWVKKSILPASTTKWFSSPGPLDVFRHLWSTLKGKEADLCAIWYFLEWWRIITCAQLLKLMYSIFSYSHWT